jgi:tRNA modification GTPase
MSDPQHDEVAHQSGAPVWRVRNKIDLGAAGPDVSGAERAAAKLEDLAEFRISASRGDGIAELVAGLVAFAEDYFGPDDGALIRRRLRCSAAFRRRVKARNSLRRTCGSRPMPWEDCSAGWTLKTFWM